MRRSVLVTAGVCLLLSIGYLIDRGDIFTFQLRGHIDFA